MDPRIQSRLAGFGAILGCLVGLGAGGMAASPPLLQNLLQNTLVDVAVYVLAVGTIICLFWWARQSADPGRMAYVVAITGAGLLVVIVNIIAPIIGWWHGPYFATRVVPLALLTGLKAMGGFGLFLLGYRWLAARRPSAALAGWGALLVLIMIGTVVGDQAVFQSGLFSFGAGYQIWHDMTLGQVFFLLPLIIYEAQSRSWLRSRLPPPA